MIISHLDMTGPHIFSTIELFSIISIYVNYTYFPSPIPVVKYTRTPFQEPVI